MTINLNTAYGIAAVLFGIAVVISIAIGMYALNLLKRSKDILDFVFFMVSKDDKHTTLAELERDKAMYDKGYANGKADEARRYEYDRAMASAWLDNAGH